MNLNISTGVKEYDINGACTVYFNPTDINFVEKLFNAFETLDSKQEEYRNKITSDVENTEAFRVMREADKTARDTIDGLFGSDVCNSVFGSISMLSGDGDGLPIWASFLLAIIDEMDEAFTREKKASNPRIKRYTEKYKKK